MKILFGTLGLLFNFIESSCKSNDLDNGSSFDLQKNELFPNFDYLQETEENLSDLKSEKIGKICDSSDGFLNKNKFRPVNLDPKKTREKREKKYVEKVPNDFMLLKNDKMKTPVISVESREAENIDFDTNEIWKLLEPTNKTKRKRIKKSKRSANNNSKKYKKLFKKKYQANNEEFKKESLIKSNTCMKTKKTKTPALNLEKKIKTYPKIRKYKTTKTSENENNETEREGSMNCAIPKAFKTTKIAKTPMFEETVQVSFSRKLTKNQVTRPVSHVIEEETEILQIPSAAVKIQKSPEHQAQTVKLHVDRMTVPTMPPPAKLSMAVNSTRKSNCFCVPDYAGTITATRTSLTILPISITNHKIVTETLHHYATQILTEILYTPYTLTATTTDTLYMIKVTTVYNGNRPNNCELDSNGMVLPANQLPPGLFAIPINEVDSSKFDIVGWAGKNSKNYNHRFNGYKLQMPRINLNSQMQMKIQMQTQIYPQY